MIKRKDLVSHCDLLLNSASFQDYCPNGLQVEGKQEINKIIAAVTASEATIKLAIDNNADALIVHHGIFWNKDDYCVVGMKKKRLALLLKHNINLIAYHLPLDAHPVIGNNAQLANELGFDDVESSDDLVFTYKAPNELTASQLNNRINKVLKRKPLWINSGNEVLRKIALCTGAAQSYIEQAMIKEADVFISGEISESTVHFANENNMHYFAAGHHATERYGVKALLENIEKNFDVVTQFLDVNNPV